MKTHGNMLLKNTTKIFTIIWIILILNGCSGSKSDDQKQTLQTKTTQDQLIEPFKPFAWNDSLYDVINKVQSMQGVEKAILTCDGFQELPLKGITQDKINHFINTKVLPFSEYNYKEYYQYYEFKDQNGNINKSNSADCRVNFSPIYLNNIAYSASITLKSSPGADVIYPKNTILIREFHLPYFLNEIKFEANDRGSETLKKSDISHEILKKYQHIKTQQKIIDNNVLSSELIDTKHNSIYVTHPFNTPVNNKILGATDIIYTQNSKSFDEAYNNRELKLREKSGISTDMGKNL